MQYLNGTAWKNDVGILEHESCFNGHYICAFAAKHPVDELSSRRTHSSASHGKWSKQ